MDANKPSMEKITIYEYERAVLIVNAFIEQRNKEFNRIKESLVAYQYDADKLAWMKSEKGDTLRITKARFRKNQKYITVGSLVRIESKLVEKTDAYNKVTLEVSSLENKKAKKTIHGYLWHKSQQPISGIGIELIKNLDLNNTKK